MSVKYTLPFGIDIETQNGHTEINSSLVEQFIIADERTVAGPVAKATADALESFLMAMASAGIDMADPRIAEALNVAVEGIANNMDDEPAIRVAVYIYGGVVQNVVSDGLIDVFVVDQDVEGSDDYIEYKNEDGLMVCAHIGKHSPECDSANIDAVEKALEQS